jgi:superfamily II RNA helicase
VACEISAADELLTSELMFSGLFSDMTGLEIAALLSALVHDESGKEEKTSVRSPRLQEKFT